MAVNQSPLTALQVMQDAPVIPVIVLNDVAHAVPMARALLAGGVRMLEVTLRTTQALACIEAIAKEVPEAVVGAGRCASCRQRGRALCRQPRLHQRGGPSLQRCGSCPATRCGDWQRNHDGAGGWLHRAQILPGHASRRPRHAEGLERPVF